MGISRGEIKFQILLKLQKSAKTKGYYTDDKMNSAITEAMDYIATEMFLADDGWNHKIDFVDAPSGTVSIPMRSQWAMIGEVRLKSGTGFIPLGYDQRWGRAVNALDSGDSGLPNTYQIIDNNLYFNPPIGEGGTGYIMVEYFAYPNKLKSDSDTLDSSFDKSMFWFIVYHSISMLGGQLEQNNDSLAAQEAKWLGRMRDIITKRTLQTITITDFEG